MSEENGKVCCNCRHNIRTGEITNIQCHCDIDGSWLSYITVMTHSCRHWSREKAETEAEDEKTEEDYVLTEWGCLSSVLTEYGIDVSHITGRVGAHIVEDFMDAMCNAGYMKKKEVKDGDDR